VAEKLCPCGSGKKISACCGGQGNIIDLTKYRWWRAGQHLRRKLAEFAGSETFFHEAEKAREIYFSVMDPELADEKDEFLVERFFEWFIFDYPIRDLTLVEYFSMSARLTEEESILLEEWKRARSSVYQVLHIDGEMITLRDLIREGELVVKDRNAARELKTGHILYIRVLPLGNMFEFSTGGLVLPAYSKNYIINRIKLDAELYWSNYKNNRDWDDYLRERAHILNALILEMGFIWDLPDKGDRNKSVEGFLNELSQQVTDIFLDYCYDHVVNQSQHDQNEETLPEESWNGMDRNGIQKLLRRLDKAVKDKKIDLYDSDGMFKGIRLPLNETARTRHAGNAKGRDDGYARVTELIRDGLKKMGYRVQQVNKAVKLWQQFSNLAQPTFRKPGAWAAAVIYALARLQGETISQHKLATMYNVSVSTISTNYRNICRTLQLNG